MSNSAFSVSGTTGLLAAQIADMQTATSNTVAVTPGTIQYSPYTVAGWVNFQGGNGSIVAGTSNASSVSHNTTGDWTVNWSPNLGLTNFGVSVTVNNGGTGAFAQVVSTSTSTTRIYAFNLAGVQIDVSSVFVAVFGASS